MLKTERTFTAVYVGGGAPGGIATLRKDGSLLVQPYRGVNIVIEGVAEAVLEENAAYLGTPGAASSPETTCPYPGMCTKEIEEGLLCGLHEGHEGDCCP